MVVVMGWWTVMVGIVVVYTGVTSAAISDVTTGGNHLDTGPPAHDSDVQLLKQIVWKRCYRRMTPACMKLSLVRTVEMLTKDSSVTILPGVSLFSNTSGTAPLPPDLARDLAPLDELASYSVSRYLRSLSLHVNLADFVTGGNSTMQTDAASGRKKGGFGGYAAVAAMLGGTMATMMMAALAALAGKALMTAMLALMMSAFSAMRGGGGGGGGGETKTYEVITKPIVSHINTHSSEVQHEHHGHYHKRSLSGGEYPVEHSPEDPSSSKHENEFGRPYEREKRHLNENPPAGSEIPFDFTPSESYNHYKKRSLDKDELNGSKMSIVNIPSTHKQSQTVGRGKRSVTFENLPDSKIYKYPNIPESLKSIYSTLRAQVQNYKAHRRSSDGSQLRMPLKFSN